MALVKIFGQRVPHHQGLRFKRSPRKNLHVLSTTLHATFNSISLGRLSLFTIFWNLSSWVSLDVFDSCLRLNSCSSKNVILLSFQKYNFHHYHLGFLICDQLFCFKNCETPSISIFVKKFVILFELPKFD